MKREREWIAVDTRIGGPSSFEQCRTQHFWLLVYQLPVANKRAYSPLSIAQLQLGVDVRSSENHRFRRIDRAKTQIHSLSVGYAGFVGMNEQIG